MECVGGSHEIVPTGTNGSRECQARVESPMGGGVRSGELPPSAVRLCHPQGLTRIPGFRGKRVGNVGWEMLGNVGQAQIGSKMLVRPIDAWLSFSIFFKIFFIRVPGRRSPQLVRAPTIAKSDFGDRSQLRLPPKTLCDADLAKSGTRIRHVLATS